MNGPASGQRATSASAPTSCTSYAHPDRVEAGPLVDLGLVHLEVEGPVRGGGQHLEPTVDVDEHRGGLRGQGGRDAGDAAGPVHR